eukprot:6544100-Prymnesium_polylepis.1
MHGDFSTLGDIKLRTNHGKLRLALKYEDLERARLPLAHPHADKRLRLRGQIGLRQQVLSLEGSELLQRQWPALKLMSL